MFTARPTFCGSNARYSTKYQGQLVGWFYEDKIAIDSKNENR